MANSKKITIAEQYDNIIAKAKDILTDEEVAFLKDRKEKHLAKNSNKKMTKTQEANEVLKADILAEMEVGKKYLIGDMIKNFECCAGLSTSKVTSMVSKLKDADLVIRTTDKGRSYFSKA